MRSSNIPNLGAILLTAALAIFCASPATAQFRLYVHAFEESTGTLVTDLEPAEVIIRVGGVIRPVVDVRPANLPARVVVLVDNSRRAGRALERVREGLREFVDRLPPYQELSLAVLSSRPDWVMQGAVEVDPMREGIDRIDIGGRSSRLVNGLAMATEWLAADAGPYRGVLVVVAADGVDRSRELNEQFAEVVEHVRRDDITVHTVLMQTVNPGSRQRRMTVPEVIGRDLETYSEGSFRTVFLGSDLRQPLGEIADGIVARSRELARQQLVRYDRPPDAPFRPVYVTVTRFGVRYIVTADGRAVTAGERGP